MNNTPQIPVNVRENLLKKLKELQQEKVQRITKKIVIVFIQSFLLIIVGGLLFVLGEFHGFIIGLSLYFIFVIFDGFGTIRRLKLKFKVEIIGNVLKHLVPSMSYHPYSKLTESNIRGSRILGIAVSKLKGDDLFKGVRGNTTFKFSEVKFSGILKGEDLGYSGKFHGVLVKCKCEIPIRKSARIFSVNSKGKMTHHNMIEVDFSDFGFENKLKGYGFKEQQYSAVFNEKFLGRIWDVKQLFGGDIYVSVFPKSAHIFVEIEKDYFEPSLKEKISMNQVERIYQEIVQCLMIVDIIDEINIQKPSKKVKNIE